MRIFKGKRFYETVTPMPFSTIELCHMTCAGLELNFPAEFILLDFFRQRMKPVVGELVFCSGEYCIIIFLCNVIIGAVTVFLNGSVLAALLRISKRLGWKTSNIILFAMVITDLCTGLICQPLHAYFIYKQENFYCESELGYLQAWLFFALNYSSYVLCCASLLITALLSLERLAAVAWAMKHRSSSTLQRTVVAVAIAVAISAITPIFRFVSKKTHIVFMALLVLIVLGALGTVIVAYTMLFRSYRQQRLAAEKLSSADKDKVRRLNQERRLAKTFAILAIVLVTMYLPQMMLKPFSILLHIKNDSGVGRIFVILEDTFNTLLYSNAAVNPFIYFSRHDLVRQEIKSFVPWCKSIDVGSTAASTDPKATQVTRATNSARS